MKLFWRAKKTETTSDALQAARPDDPGHGGAAGADAVPPTAPDAARNDLVANDAASDLAKAESGDGQSRGAAASSEDTPLPSNVVTLQPVKLTERIAAAAKTVVTYTHSGDAVAETLQPRPAGPLPGQTGAYHALQRALSSPRGGGHVLITGASGTGRRTAAQAVIEAARRVIERPCDWLYVATPGEGRRLKVFSLPHGQGALFSREARAAIARAGSNHERLTSGDDYRLGLEIIDEEFRHRNGKTLDHLKRRAEGQNIALVKTPEGFVLAPMHEGKVVRSDVFRALPEALQRDVEAKIAGLEGELKSFIEQLPAEDAAQADRITAFNHEAASRAIRPHFEGVRTAFNDAGDVLDTLEASLVAVTAGAVRRTESGQPLPASSVQVLAAQTAGDFAEVAPLIVAHDVSAAALLGEIGVDGAGRLSLKSGDLMRANGGFLIIEAWRLACAPEAWAALSAALQSGEIRPRAAGGLVIESEAVPLSLKVVLVADDASWQRLCDIDPGAPRFFPYTVRFPASVPRAELGLADYGTLAAACAAAKGLRRIATSAADTLYRAAEHRGGNGAAVALDMHALTNLLYEADLEAGAAHSEVIRAADIEAAARRIGGAMPS
ncbi:MAG: AAA family ATPase [Hyphomicrobium sp.]